MSEIKLETAPTLTLEPFENIAKAPQELVVVEEEVAVEQLEDSNLTEEEKQMVDTFAASIELTNSNVIMQYGAGAQKKIADFSETALGNVRSKDLGEVGELLGTVVTELKNFDDEEEEKGFLGFFKKSKDKIESFKVKYDKAESNIDKVVDALEGHQVQLMKDAVTLDKMYDLNKTYFKELSMYILAGKKRLAEVRAVQVPALKAKATASGLPEDAQEANDLVAMCNRFEKKIHDLELTRVISLQMAPQIRLVQNNDTLMSEKIQSTIVNTIPLWKSQMVLTLGINHSLEAAKAQRAVTDMTNTLLQKNAETLKMATIETAKESERGIVDIETLKYTNESLISTLDEVMKIQEEGHTKRQEAEVELKRMEGELKNKLLELR